MIRFWCLQLVAVCLLSSSFAQGKIQKLALDNVTAWQIYDRTIASASKDTVTFPHGEKDGLWLFNQEGMKPKSIEFDVRGENNMDRSYVGVVFHAQDAKNYEGIYFRPFNFYNPDTIRRWRAVQYICMPQYPWYKLRASDPGKYENKVLNAPNGDDWFHVKITIDDPVIKVYVNSNPVPTLVVNSLSRQTSGKIGLWMGPQACASFANVVVRQ